MGHYTADELRKIAKSPYLDPFVVYKNHWLCWNWGYLSSNPAIPAWLVVALPTKPWDWLSLEDLPCSHTLRKRVPHTFVHQKSVLERIQESDDDARHICEIPWKYRCGVRIGNEIYRRIIIPRRRQRWLSIVKKTLHKRSHRIVNGTIASFLAPPASPDNNALSVIS